MQCQAMPLELPDLANLWPTVASPSSRTTAEGCGASIKALHFQWVKCALPGRCSGQKGPGDSSLVRLHHQLGSTDEQSIGWDKYCALQVGTGSAYI